jgi:hypothetical protein
VNSNSRPQQTSAHFHREARSQQDVNMVRQRGKEEKMRKGKRRKSV